MDGLAASLYSSTIHSPTIPYCCQTEPNYPTVTPLHSPTLPESHHPRTLSPRAKPLQSLQSLTSPEPCLTEPNHPRAPLLHNLCGKNVQKILINLQHYWNFKRPTFLRFGPSLLRKSPNFNVSALPFSEGWLRPCIKVQTDPYFKLFFSACVCSREGSILVTFTLTMTESTANETGQDIMTGKFTFDSFYFSSETTVCLFVFSWHFA